MKQKKEEMMNSLLTSLMKPVDILVIPEGSRDQEEQKLEAIGGSVMCSYQSLLTVNDVEYTESLYYRFIPRWLFLNEWVADSVRYHFRNPHMEYDFVDYNEEILVWKRSLLVEDKIYYSGSTEVPIKILYSLKEPLERFHKFLKDALEWLHLTYFRIGEAEMEMKDRLETEAWELNLRMDEIIDDLRDHGVTLGTGW